MVRPTKGLEFVRYVVKHACALRMLRIEQVQLYHKLTSITDTERKGVLSVIETTESFMCRVIVKGMLLPILWLNPIRPSWRILHRRR